MQLETLYKIINNVAGGCWLGERKVLYLLYFCVDMYVCLSVCTMEDMWRSWSLPCRSQIEHTPLDLAASPFAY